MVLGDWEVLAGLAVWRGGGAGWVWIVKGERGVGLGLGVGWGGGVVVAPGSLLIGMGNVGRDRNLLVMLEGKIRRRLLGWIRLDY
jgi:hypothetical protein